MRIVVQWFFVLGLGLALAPATVDGQDQSRFTARHRAGDDPRWAAPDWDDRDWEVGNTVPVGRGVHWVRFRFVTRPDARASVSTDRGERDVSGLGPGATVDSVFMAAPYSYELFADGRRIGGSGVVGATKATERVGPLDHVFMIPAELRAPGEHVVAIRLSSFHFNFPSDEVVVSFLPSNAARHYAEQMRRPVLPLISVGAAGLVALLSAVLFWVAGRWRPLLLCSGLSLALAFFYLLIAWRWLHNDPYDWFQPRLWAIAGIMTLIAALFPWLLLEQFGLARGRRWWLWALLAPLLAAAWAASPIYEFKVMWMCRATLAISLVIAGWAVWRRRAGARFVFAGVLVGLLTVRTVRREFLDAPFTATFGVLVLGVFTTLGLQLRADRRRAQAATLAAARLEIELLKKNIQPHFLMNTLTAITEIIEQEPKSAVNLIEALAGEFRIVARVSGEKLIPLGQELELCRAHLRIMSLRRTIACSLEVTGADERAMVPPALLHTLVEGGVTHQTPRDGELKFTLAVDAGEERTCYTLTAHGVNPPAPRPPQEGTGLRYVKARLEESFAGRWSLEAGPVAEGWRTVIEIRADTGEAGRT